MGVRFCDPNAFEFMHSRLQSDEAHLDHEQLAQTA